MAENQQSGDIGALVVLSSEGEEPLFNVHKDYAISPAEGRYGEKAKGIYDELQSAGDLIAMTGCSINPVQGQGLRIQTFGQFVKSGQGGYAEAVARYCLNKHELIVVYRKNGN